MTLGLSPSLVDQYFYWRHGEHYSREQEMKAHADLVAAAKKIKTPPTEPMLRGRGWGAVVENPCYEAGDVYLDPDSGTKFDAEDVRTARSRIEESAVFEAWGTLKLPEIGVEMRLRADALAAPVVVEIKSTSRIKAERYQASCQWRAYLLAFDCDKCLYHLYRHGKRRGTGIYYVADYLSLPLYRYKRMREDLVFQVAECKRYLESQGLDKHRQKES